MNSVSEESYLVEIEDTPLGYSVSNIMDFFFKKPIEE